METFTQFLKETGVSDDVKRFAEIIDELKKPPYNFVPDDDPYSVNSIFHMTRELIRGTVGDSEPILGFAITPKYISIDYVNVGGMEIHGRPIYWPTPRGAIRGLTDYMEFVKLPLAGFNSPRFYISVYSYLLSDVKDVGSMTVDFSFTARARMEFYNIYNDPEIRDPIQRIIKVAEHFNVPRHVILKFKHRLGLLSHEEISDEDIGGLI
jgi:hypothetical protein